MSGHYLVLYSCVKEVYVRVTEEDKEVYGDIDENEIAQKIVMDEIGAGRTGHNEILRCEELIDQDEIENAERHADEKL